MNRKQRRAQASTKNKRAAARVLAGIIEGEAAIAKLERELEELRRSVSHFRESAHAWLNRVRSPKSLP